MAQMKLFPSHLHKILVRNNCSIHTYIHTIMVIKVHCTVPLFWIDQFSAGTGCFLPGHGRLVGDSDWITQLAQRPPSMHYIDASLKLHYIKLSSITFHFIKVSCPVITFICSASHYMQMYMQESYVTSTNAMNWKP